MSDFNSTPRSNRLHIGIFGRRNAGKSTLINAICGHQTAVVSDVAGTTTDPVYKSMEIHGLGPCVLIDTAGFDDEGKLGRLRMEKTKDAAAKTDVAILLFDADIPPDDELEQKQFLLILQNCMDRLPKKLSRLFLMRDIFEDDNQAICKELDISPTNAWVMLYRARMGLRKCLELHWLEN